MSQRTTLLRINNKLINLHIWCSGSIIDPYANTWFSKNEPIKYNPTNYKAFNWRFGRVTLCSGEKVWRWSNSTPKWLKSLINLKDEYNNRNAWNFTGNYTEDGEMIMEPYVSIWQFIRVKVKRLTCNHDMRIWDSGGPEYGPHLEGCCAKCGKSL